MFKRITVLQPVNYSFSKAVDYDIYLRDKTSQLYDLHIEQDILQDKEGFVYLHEDPKLQSDRCRYDPQLLSKIQNLMRRKLRTWSSGNLALQLLYERDRKSLTKVSCDSQNKALEEELESD